MATGPGSAAAGDKLNADPWAESAASLPNRKDGAAQLPAHIRKEPEEAMAAQIKTASDNFETTAKKVTDEARNSFLQSITNITANLSTRQGANEHDLLVLQQ
ncbi:unnamed protein product [Prorocentrum cordatum]|uniref:Uncharacterized protein n=1 Tax=Prorocentrum cordatum TaxID=2364126 RepID=A0ABN9PQN8_9DINO|nr:unnamed protein product [Polarella glacialis]